MKNRGMFGKRGGGLTVAKRRRPAAEGWTRRPRRGRHRANVFQAVEAPPRLSQRSPIVADNAANSNPLCAGADFVGTHGAKPRRKDDRERQPCRYGHDMEQICRRPAEEQQREPVTNSERAIEQ